MLDYAIPFLIITVLSAILGFSGIVSGVAVAGQALFFVFLLLLIVSLLVDSKPGD